MVLAAIKFYFGVLQKITFRFAYLLIQVGILIFLPPVSSHDFSVALKDELPAVDAHPALRADKIHAKAIHMLHGNAGGIYQPGPSFVPVCRWWQHLHRPAGVHTQTPLRDVEMVGAPVRDHAAAELGVIAPIREMLVDAARREN